ncbi:MAG: TVP38/TMEM64 family protein [Bacilli bacterium]
MILLKYEKENNNEAINEFLRDKGILGMLMLVILQALDMVVVFMSAELVQIPAGICYPWYISIFLLDLGVFIGASIIFILVRLLKFDSSIFKKASNKIDNMIKREKKHRGFQSLMYILFIMPIIPFGAICYYGASTKMSYKRYILTCITGVLPSIFMSIFLSNMITEFISHDIPLYILVIIALVFMIILFSLLTFVINKLYFINGKGTPNSAFYSILFTIIGFIVKLKAKLTFDKKDLDKIDEPYIILTNHQSFFDFYFIGNLVQLLTFN